MTEFLCIIALVILELAVFKLRVLPAPAYPVLGLQACAIQLDLKYNSIQFKVIN